MGNLIGNFVSNHVPFNGSEDEQEEAKKRGCLFRNIVWGVNGIEECLKPILAENYGTDLELILLQYYILPHELTRPHIREVECFRPKEKSIGLSIIIELDFFDWDEAQQRKWLKEMVVQRLNDLAIRIKRKRHNMAMDRVIEDVNKLLQNYN